jgi:tRNA(fMet)-specific endonuclease VapC
MTTYLLDTNIASHIIKGDIPAVRQRLVAVPMHKVAISVITEAELRYGLSKRGHPPGLTLRIDVFLKRVHILAWSSDAALTYADLRVACEAAGRPLSPLDMMIASHARAIGATLVTSDRAFARAPVGLMIEDWTC